MGAWPSRPLSPGALPGTGGLLGCSARPLCVLLLCAGLQCQLAVAGDDPAGWSSQSQPRVAIIIDDLGQRLGYGLRAVQLPGPVTCAFLPRAPYSKRLAELAYRGHKEVILHLPMEAVSQKPLDPGGLTINMPRSDLVAALRADIEAIPHVRGINNHMGSLLTQHTESMEWVMAELMRRKDLYFVDSYTTARSVVSEVATEYGIPHRTRDVFLDALPGAESIERAFRHLLTIARRDGTALAIAHPYPRSLAFLQSRIPGLVESGIDLVPVSDLIDRPGAHPIVASGHHDLHSAN